MRWLLLVLVLAGCGGGGVYRPPAEVVADYDRRNAEALRSLPTEQISPAQAARRDEAARQREYCDSFAFDVYQGSVGLSERFADSALGYSTRRNRLYADCMASFSRVDRYLGR